MINIVHYVILLQSHWPIYVNKPVSFYLLHLRFLRKLLKKKYFEFRTDFFFRIKFDLSSRRTFFALDNWTKDSQKVLRLEVNIYLNVWKKGVPGYESLKKKDVLLDQLFSCLTKFKLSKLINKQVSYEARKTRSISEVQNQDQFIPRKGR